MTDSSRAATASTVAAVAATVAALAAVVIAFWDNVQSRQHNRLSVLPYVDVTLDRRGYGDGTLLVENEGTGPAIIQGMTIRMKTPAGRDTTFATWAPAARLLQQGGVRLMGWADLDSTSAVGVQKQMTMLRFQAPDSAVGGVDLFQRFVESFRVEVRYASVYGERRVAEWSAHGQ